MKQNFFAWYYTKGLENLLEIVKNYLSFFWRFFSISKLTLTLFSPWKRDIVFQNWRGLQPLKTLETLVDNLISRVIGGIVRSIVILSGLIFILAYIVFGVALVLTWLFPPAIFFSIMLNELWAFPAFIMTSLIFVFYILLTVLTYQHSSKKSFPEMELSELIREPWFERICNRMGKNPKDLDRKIFENNESLAKFLESVDLNVNDFELILSLETGYQQKIENQKQFWLKENLDNIPAIGRQWTYAYTTHLDNYALDLTNFDPTEYRNAELVGRNDELDIIKLILSRTEENSVLLVGDAGSGKLTIIHHLSRMIRLGKCDNFLKNKRLLLLDLGKMISDCIDEGNDVEGTLRSMFAEAAYAGNVILVIENMENFLGREGKTFHPDISSVIAEFLPLPTFQIIATSTQKEYHKLIEKHEGFMKYFEVVEVIEPGEEETIKIILQKFEKLESKRIVFTYQALKKIITYSGQYRWNIPLPERALDLTDEILMFWEKNPQEYFITERTVDEFLSLKTKIPHGEVKGDEREKLLNLEKILHNRVIGQEEAVKEVAQALQRARSGIANPKRPIGSFLFLGPTGVGKTETAKALAEAYFGNEEKMIRFDMSEFQSPLSIDRLIGSTQLNQPGELITKAKDYPFSILLLDEIEKAYPEILNLFLQVLDEGYVTDVFGEKANFRNMIIIATSNAGASLIKELTEAGESPDRVSEKVIDYAVQNNVFHLEFLNRFDGIIYFRPLTVLELQSVTKLMLSKFANRLKKIKNIEVAFDGEAVDKIIENGYNQTFGARSIYRFVEDKVENLVAKKIISGEAKKGEVIMIKSQDI